MNSATVVPGSLRPVAPEERVGALDLLRGWAMFGVLWSNLNDVYAKHDSSTPLNWWLGWVQGQLIESRFYALLIILFGIGFGIQLVRADRSGRDVRVTYYRRSAALLAIGIVHGTLIWRGDILTIYALVAFALVMFRSLSTRGVLIAALIMWFVGPVFIAEVQWFAGLRFTLPDSSAGTAALYSHGTWMQIERVRAQAYLEWLQDFGLRSYPRILASFLVGLWAFKSGYMQRVFTQSRATWRLLGISLVAAAVGYAYWHWGNTLYPIPTPWATVPDGFPYPYFQLMMLRYFVLHAFDWGTEGTALAYACVLLLIWQRARGEKALRPLAAAGRMALTTYLTQSVVCTLLFYSYGLGWSGRVGFTGALVITVVLFTVQMALSTWWLARFRYGPVEWLWRTLTYGTAPAMRIA